MLLFIALPIVSVSIQSLFVEHEQVMKEVENCGPFKCTTVLQVDTEVGHVAQHMAFAVL